MTAMLAEKDAEVEKPQTPASCDATAPQQQQALHVQEPFQEATHRPRDEAQRQNRWKIWHKWTDGSDSSWWFASTGIPLLAACLGPLANVSSIAALVTSWRQNNYLDGGFVSDLFGVPYADPRWCYWLNVVSLICGFLGNVFLLCNFTQKIRYVIALPTTIIFWYISSGLLTAITACMEVYAPPNRPYEIYTQGYWYAVAAAVFYFVCSVLLMVNMLGYHLGHYPDHFALSDSQRTLILQTMFFFIWIAGGAAIYSRIQTDAGEDQWTFPNSLYFCYVTILTVGFGDLVATTDLGRGLLFPYSVGGIITLGLIVSSLYRAARELGEDHIVRKDIRRRREQALELTATNSEDYRHRQRQLVRRSTFGRLKISAPSQPRPYRTAMGNNVQHTSSFSRSFGVPPRVDRKSRILLLKEEKDRFDAMRRIQADSERFKRWMNLIWSVTTFLILWCIGAVVFWQTERGIQGMTYFQALYFCYISLLTIGYGDLSPKSNPGRCFFVIWSLISVPTMTILVSDLGDTVVAKFKKWSNIVADFTILPKRGIWQPLVDKHPWLQQRIQDRKAKRRIREGFATADPNAGSGADDDNNVEAAADTLQATALNITSLAAEAETDLTQAPTQASLSRRIALSIKKVSSDLRLDKPKRYSYEEWVEFTRLIRYTTPRRLNRVLGTMLTNETENEEGLVNWDWLGEHSPMVAGVSESEWLLERLVESLIRLEKRREIACDHGDIVGIRDMEVRLQLSTLDAHGHDAGSTNPSPYKN
ncbi:voltage-gated potassium channel [Macroventuria anomochaeta]|uniref:Voltage-gated potassium channel n=1 Tax=Macroventuria anomochaeta TaxID=301207 RepID=A0ACB6RMZ5_9PLEO|nr:voltage-gated potassium channel [Macroventuria anomochaeta]KAF2623310.1 voltage-gated potassium channel [Macroventuria anomochaeta]